MTLTQRIQVLLDAANLLRTVGEHALADAVMERLKVIAGQPS